MRIGGCDTGYSGQHAVVWHQPGGPGDLWQIPQPFDLLAGELLRVSGCQSAGKPRLIRVMMAWQATKLRANFLRHQTIS
jgi:hypothetical protein